MCRGGEEQCVTTDVPGEPISPNSPCARCNAARNEKSVGLATLGGLRGFAKCISNSMSSCITTPLSSCFKSIPCPFS